MLGDVLAASASRAPNGRSVQLEQGEQLRGVATKSPGKPPARSLKKFTARGLVSVFTVSSEALGDVKVNWSNLLKLLTNGERSKGVCLRCPG